MRASLVLLAAAASLAACVNQSAPPQAVAAAPPSVSYQITGNDIGRANAQADGYCQQYGMYANLQGVQPNGGQGIATYVCAGSRVSNAGAPPPPYTASVPYGAPPPAPGVRCADPLHQSLPGGTDYRGPPVYGCP